MAADALADCGGSILLSSATNAIAFAISAVSPLPALRGFCTYAAVGMLADLVFQLTFFVAALVLDERRLATRRAAAAAAAASTAPASAAVADSERLSSRLSFHAFLATLDDNVSPVKARSSYQDYLRRTPAHRDKGSSGGGGLLRLAARAITGTETPARQACFSARLCVLFVFTITLALSAVAGFHVSVGFSGVEPRGQHGLAGGHVRRAQARVV